MMTLNYKNVSVIILLIYKVKPKTFKVSAFIWCSPVAPLNRLPSYKKSTFIQCKDTGGVFFFFQANSDNCMKWLQKHCRVCRWRLTFQSFLMKESSDTDWCLSYLLMTTARTHNRYLHTAQETLTMPDIIMLLLSPGQSWFTV